LNGGEITFNHEGTVTDATTSFRTTENINLTIDTERTSISFVETPVEKTYLLGEPITFTVHFEETVFTTGTPTLKLDINGSQVFARYISGSNSSTLLFRYTVDQTDVDNDGIDLISPVQLSGGEVLGNNGNEALLSFTPPSMLAVIVNGSQTKVLAIQNPTDKTYNLSDELFFTLEYNTEVTVSGKPELELIFDSSSPTNNAIYVSGTASKNLIFKYIIQAGDTDIDGVELGGNILLKGGSIESTSGVSSQLNIAGVTTALDLTGILVETPTIFISQVSVPENFTYKAGSVLEFNITANEIVHITGLPRIQLNIGGTTKYATYTSGSGTKTMIFQYTIEAGLIDMDGINTLSSIDLNAGTIKNSFGDNLDTNFTLPNTANIFIDTIAPIIAISAPLNDTILNFESSSETYGILGTCNEAGRKVSIKIDNIEANSQVGFICDGTQFSGTINTTAHSEGALNLTAILSDSAGNSTTSSVVQMVKDTIVPTVSITSSPNITAANQTVYNIYGTCSENDQAINLLIGGASLSPLCHGGSWSSGIVDVSGINDTPSFLITADISDTAGNSALQASTTIDKNTTISKVTINPLDDITSSNQTAYNVAGTCTENGVIVSIDIGAILIQPNCTSGTWSTGAMDLSALADNASITILATHDTALQASQVISKDTLSPTVTISSSPNIGLGNQLNYIASGTCSKNGVAVTIDIGGEDFSNTCVNGSWSTGIIDVSNLTDNQNINFTVGHSTFS